MLARMTETAAGDIETAHFRGDGRADENQNQRGQDQQSSAVKKAEDDDALVLRFYEWAGKDVDVKLQLPTSAKGASETDLMERPIAELAAQGGSVTIHEVNGAVTNGPALTVQVQLQPGEVQILA